MTVWLLNSVRCCTVLQVTFTSGLKFYFGLRIIGIHVSMIEIMYVDSDTVPIGQVSLLVVTDISKKKGQ